MFYISALFNNFDASPLIPNIIIGNATNSGLIASTKVRYEVMNGYIVLIVITIFLSRYLIEKAFP